jgi:hypothetical protein
MHVNVNASEQTILEFTGGSDSNFLSIVPNKTGEPIFTIQRQAVDAGPAAEEYLANNLLYCEIVLPFESSGHPVSVALDIDPRIGAGVQHVYAFFVTSASSRNSNRRHLGIMAPPSAVSGDLYIVPPSDRLAISRVDSIDDASGHGSSDRTDADAFGNTVNWITEGDVNSLVDRLDRHKQAESPPNAGELIRWKLSNVSYALVVTGPTSEHSNYRLTGLLR